MSSNKHIPVLDPNKLLGTFHAHCQCYEHLVQEATSNTMDSTVLERLGDDLDEDLSLVLEV